MINQLKKIRCRYWIHFPAIGIVLPTIVSAQIIPFYVIIKLEIVKQTISVER